jgi:hypothetical protein
MRLLKKHCFCYSEAFDKLRTGLGSGMKKLYFSTTEEILRFAQNDICAPF